VYERESRNMMATKALHKLGDLSCEEPSLCVVWDEDDECYIGMWVVGIGFTDVRFPKSTTRELTEEEKTEWGGKWLEIGGRPFQVTITE